MGKNGAEEMLGAFAAWIFADGLEGHSILFTIFPTQIGCGLWALNDHIWRGSKRRIIDVKRFIFNK